MSASKGGGGGVGTLNLTLNQITNVLNNLGNTAKAAEEAAPVDTGPGADIEYTKRNSADIGRKIQKILSARSNSLTGKNETEITFTDEEKTQLKGITSKEQWDTVPEETRKKVVQVERVQYKFTSSSNKFLKEFYKNARPVPIERTSK